LSKENSYQKFGYQLSVKNLCVSVVNRNPLFKTSQNHSKTCKNLMIFDENRSKAVQNLIFFEEI